MGRFDIQFLPARNVLIVVDKVIASFLDCPRIDTCILSHLRGSCCADRTAQYWRYEVRVAWLGGWFGDWGRVLLERNGASKRLYLSLWVRRDLKFGIASITWLLCAVGGGVMAYRAEVRKGSGTAELATQAPVGLEECRLQHLVGWD